MSDEAVRAAAKLKRQAVRRGYYGPVVECLGCHTALKRVDGRYEHVIKAQGDWSVTSFCNPQPATPIEPDGERVATRPLVDEALTTAWRKYDMRDLHPYISRDAAREAVEAAARAPLEAAAERITGRLVAMCLNEDVSPHVRAVVDAVKADLAAWSPTEIVMFASRVAEFEAAVRVPLEAAVAEARDAYAGAAAERDELQARNAAFNIEITSMRASLAALRESA